jgi:integrase
VAGTGVGMDPRRANPSGGATGRSQGVESYFYLVGFTTRFCVVLLPRAKAGARPVILNAEAQKLLRAQFEAHPASEWIFPGPEGRPYERSYVGRVFQRGARAAGLRDFHFHDLRHHGATMALNRGFTAPIVMALGGWKTERMMWRYAAVTDQTLRAAAEAVSGSESGWKSEPTARRD